MLHINRLSVGLVACLLAGCGPVKTEVKPTPAVVSVAQYIYVPIPKELLKHCDIDLPANSTGLEAYRVATLRGLSLKDCNIRLDKIGSIQGTPVPPDQPKGK